MILKSLELACRLTVFPCSLLVGCVTWEAHGRWWQQKSFCFYTQLTKTLVSAAIAGHMTEAVAGMTVQALATGGGGSRRWKGVQGVQTQGKGRREDSTSFPFAGVDHCFL